MVLIPAAAAILATTLLNWGMEPPRTWSLRLGWWAILLAVSTVVAMAVQTQTRRLLPLAVLFKLTLLFPDEAPSRYRMARASANPQKLRELSRGRSPQAQAATHVLAWVAQLSRHDRHTRGHSERVRVFADLIVEQLKITGLDRDKLRWAALLHDIGKLQVPAAVLNKPAKPTPGEWDVLRGHPSAGMALVGPLAAWLGPWAGGIADHHERYDGTGYPNGLRGDQISLAGRIVCVADAYETMTAARSYKRPVAAATGRAELARCAGTHFDPVVVRAFLAVGLPRLLHGIGPISFLVHLPFLTRLPEAGLGLLTAAGQMATPVAAGLTAASVAGAGVVTPLAAPLAHAHRPTASSSSVSTSTRAESPTVRGVELSASVATRSSTASGTAGTSSSGTHQPPGGHSPSTTSTAPSASTVHESATTTSAPSGHGKAPSDPPSTAGSKGSGGSNPVSKQPTAAGTSKSPTTSNAPKTSKTPKKSSTTSSSDTGSASTNGSNGKSSSGTGNGAAHGNSGKAKGGTTGG